jgi:hypothetical protein
MRKHCQTVHEEQRGHKCRYCKRRFVTAAVMRQHCSAVHEKVSDHACSYCPGVAFELRAEEAHQRSAREDPEAVKCKISKL